MFLWHAGANGLLLGFCLTLNSCGEVPVFYFSGAIIKRIGIDTSFNIAMGAFVLRLGCYGVGQTSQQYINARLLPHQHFLYAPSHCPKRALPPLGLTTTHRHL